jgi:membrane protein
VWRHGGSTRRYREASVSIDRYQRHHSWIGLPLAVIYKFLDDQGAYLSALVTYYALVSLFPLFLIAASVLGFVLSGDPHLQAEVLGSSLAQFPIVGTQIQNNLHEYTGSGVALVIGVLGTLYGGLRVAQSAQNAMNTAWAVPRNARPNPIKSRVRSFAFLAVLGLGMLLTTGLTAVPTGGKAYGLDVQVPLRIGAIILAVALNVGLFVAAYRYLTVREVSVRAVLLGAGVAAMAWQGLQSLGTYYIAHRLRGAQEVYGVFGVVLGLVAWLYIESVIVVICAELNVVLAGHLWPRSLRTPWADDIALTTADEVAFRSHAQAQRFKDYETISVSFSDPRRLEPPAPAGPLPVEADGAAAIPSPPPTSPPTTGSG